MNALDTDHASAIDGAGGGDYLPTAVIGIKGKGISVGKALGDDTYFSTANAKWAGAAADFSGGPTLALKLVDLCAFNESRLLAVANNAADKIALSLDDGFSWRDVSASIASPQTITLACCAAADNIMIAAGNSAKVYYSVDTTSWAFITLGGSPTSLTKAHYHKTLDLFIIIGSTAGAPYLASITSGISGTPRTVPPLITGAQPGYSITEATSGANVGRLAATWGSQTRIAFSDNGTAWAASATLLTSGNYRVAFGDGVFVALDSGASTTAYVSSDANTWTTSGVTKPTTQSLQGFACLNGVFCAIDTLNNVWFSVDRGLTWEFMTLQYLGYNTASSMRAVRKRLHSLQTDGTNSVNMRSRRLGFSDGTI